MSEVLRPELPPMIGRIARLPVSRGYPVPWFVAWMHNGTEVRPGVGEPDFRVIAAGKVMRAHRDQLCWICGERLGAFKAFLVGPMCVVNRVSSEPPSHTDCARWAAEACPFLTRPHMRRRENDLPDEAEKAAGIAIDRNPGIAVVYVTKKYKVIWAPNGILFRMGDRVRVEWIREGRLATRTEVMEAIESGLPALQDVARKQGGYAEVALAVALERAVEVVDASVPS